MSRDSDIDIGEIGDALADCAGQCRRSLCKEELHARAYRRPWNQALLDRFLQKQCAEDPELAWIATMLYAQARSDLANRLLPGIERCLGRYVYDEYSVELPPKPLRPELVVDNSGSGEQSPQGSEGKKGKRAAIRPAGDAA